MATLPLVPSTILKGLRLIDFCTSASVNLRPIKRLTACRVRVGLVTACRLATCPTSRSLLSTKATTDGVVLFPSELAITFGSPPSITATQELVVPRSIPMILPIIPLLISYKPDRQFKSEFLPDIVSCQIILYHNSHLSRVVKGIDPLFCRKADHWTAPEETTTRAARSRRSL